MDRIALALAVLLAPSAGGQASKEKEQVIFEDSFRGKLADGWSWVREDKAAWRAGKEALEVRVQPGNVWGRKNDAKNILVRPLPDPMGDKLVIEVAVKLRPAAQYEQAGLVWYVDDDHMVKLVKELVDGKVHLVMGREEGERGSTVAMLPADGETFHLRYTLHENRLTGSFRTDPKSPWKEAGSCELPGKGPGKISLQAYNGQEKEERWAAFSAFSVRRVKG